MKADTGKRWFITGVSSGLGRALAEAALERGDTVAGTLRNTDAVDAFRARTPDRAHAFLCDVRDEDAVHRAVAQAAAAMGSLDVVVNNAGYCLAGEFESTTSEQVARQFDVNVMGAMHVTRAALPILRAAGAGRIINIGSLSSVIGYPGMSLYTASKFALAGFSEALAREVAGFGIRVTVVAPSGFRTRFAGASLDFAAEPAPGYEGLRDKLREGLARSNNAQPNDPARGAAALLALADHPEPPIHFALGHDALARIRDALGARLEEYETHGAMGANTAFPPTS